MPHLNKEIFVCLDCETTGLDPANDRVVEVAVARFTFDEILGQFEALVNPGCPIPETAIAVHRITQDMVEGKPTIKSILPEIIEFIGDHIIIGHGVQFDIDLIVHAAKRENIPCNLAQNPSLDTLRMARLYGESPVNSLEKLRMHFNIQAEGAHRAMNDVIVNMEVFKRLASFYRTTEQIFEALKKPILFKIMPLGKHKGRPLKDIPLDYLLWAARQKFDRDLLFSLRTEIKKRKQGNQFSQAANPFAAL